MNRRPDGNAPRFNPKLRWLPVHSASDLAWRLAWGCAHCKYLQFAAQIELVGALVRAMLVCAKCGSVRNEEVGLPKGEPCPDQVTDRQL